jgi:hypothetical protein
MSGRHCSSWCRAATVAPNVGPPLQLLMSGRHCSSKCRDATASPNVGPPLYISCEYGQPLGGQTCLLYLSYHPGITHACLWIETNLVSCECHDNAIVCGPYCGRVSCLKPLLGYECLSVTELPGFNQRFLFHKETNHFFCLGGLYGWLAGHKWLRNN